MNSKNSKASESYRRLINFSNKIKLKGSDIYIIIYI